MTIAGGQIAGAAASREAAEDWQAVRDAADIQYAPLAPPEVPKATEPPEWLEGIVRIFEAIGRALESVLGPIGRWLGMSWPTFKWILISLAVLLVLLLVWRILAPLIARWRNREVPDEGAIWAPSQAEAVALLEDADRLAGEGRFGEAAHLLLRRSVVQIAEARPNWLTPASTAREIAVLPMLPEAGRRAFAMIASRVEQCHYALRDLNAGDWAAARAAYSDFASIEIGA